MRTSIPLILLLLILPILTTSCGNRVASDFQGNQSPQPATSTQTKCALPTPNSYVSDYAKVIDQTTKDELEGKLRNLKSSGNIDFVIVVVDTTGGTNIFDYSLALAQCWSVGGKNPDKAGLLLLVAVNDRKWRIQITRVLEKVLTNDEVGELGNQMAPDFKRSRYGDGINKCVDAMIDTLAKRRGLSISKT